MRSTTYLALLPLLAATAAAVDCEDGHGLINDGDTECSLCPAGTFAAAGTDVKCTSCANSGGVVNRKWAPAGSKQCIVCGGGTTTQTNSYSTCMCQNGLDPFIPSQNTCTCQAGYYMTPSLGCRACPAGRYSTVVGAFVTDNSANNPCTFCPPGTQNPLQGQSSPDACTPCPVDTMSNGDGGFPYCDPCQDGYWTNGLTGQTQCVDKQSTFTCPPGQEYIQEVTSCQYCRPGSYSDKDTHIGETCQPCPVNTYFGGTGATQCTQCEDGKWTDGGTGKNTCSAILCTTDGQKVSGNGCVACEPGTARTAPNGFTTCNKCSIGQYQPNPGAATCLSCPSNTGTQGATTCNTTPQTCPAGQFGPSGVAPCSPCPSNTFNNSPGASTCTNCASGSTSTPGATACSSSGGGGGNSPCPAGQFRKNLRSRCQDCDQDYYSAAGATRCTKCPTGQISPAGSDHCTTPSLCPPGKYRPSNLHLDCKPCDRDTYSNKPGAIGSCTQCPRGQTAPPGSERCTPRCNPGQWLSGSTCKSCTAGTYSTTSGATRCDNCPQGTYSKGGASACTKCDKGYYNQYTGKDRCQACSPGWTTSGKGATSPSACYRGR